MGSFSYARRVLVACATPVLLFSLAACGQDKSQDDTAASSEGTTTSATPSPSATTASPTPTPTPEPTTEQPTPEVVEEPSEEPTEEPSPSSTPANLEANEQEKRMLFASEEELAKIHAENDQAVRDNGRDPQDDYVKYGEVLCQGEAFPTSDELRSVGASDAFVSWYEQYVNEAPQYIHDMSAGNRAVEEQGAEAPAVDQAKCQEYGLL